MKKLKLLIPTLFLFTMITTQTHAQVINDAKIDGDYETIDKSMNSKFKGLKGSPNFNFVTVDTDKDLDTYASDYMKENKLVNSVSVFYNSKDNGVSLQVSKNLEKDFTEGIQEQMLNSSGVTKLNVGNVEQGLSELTNTIFSVSKTSSLGNNTYDYAKEKADNKKKETNDTKKAKAKKDSKIFIIMSLVLGAIALLVVYFMYNRKSSSSKVTDVVLSKQKTKAKEAIKVDIMELFQKESFIQDLGLDYLKKSFDLVNFTQDYLKLQDTTKDNYFKRFDRYLGTQNLGTIESLNVEQMLINNFSKSIDDYKENVEKLFVSKSKEIFTKYPPQIFDKYQYLELIRRQDLTKAMIREYAEHETTVFNESVAHRISMFNKLVKEIIETISFDVTDEYKQSLIDMEKIIAKNYSTESNYTDDMFIKNYEKDVYHDLKEHRLSIMDLDDSIIKYLNDNVSEKDLAMCTNKVFNRYVDKAKILSK